MRAIVLEKFGGPDSLVIKESPSLSRGPTLIPEHWTSPGCYERTFYRYARYFSDSVQPDSVPLVPKIMKHLSGTAKCCYSQTFQSVSLFRLAVPLNADARPPAPLGC